MAENENTDETRSRMSAGQKTLAIIIAVLVGLIILFIGHRYGDDIEAHLRGAYEETTETVEKTGKEIGEGLENVRESETADELDAAGAEARDAVQELGDAVEDATD